MAKRATRYSIAVILLFLIFPSLSEAVKIVTWNLLKLSANTIEGRIEDFHLVMEDIQPDILIVQEICDLQGTNIFLNQVMNFSSKTYKKAAWMDGPDTDNMAFYNRKRIRLISRRQIYTDLRDISEFRFKVKRGYSRGAKFKIYSVHLKAGTASADKKQKGEEAELLRNYLNGLPSNSPFLICGDFNFYTSSEEGFQVLTESQGDNDGRALDPLDSLGKWHDKRSFAEIHTQSPRKARFGGGAYGGLDDRFDLFLISTALLNHKKLAYVEDSYIAYGNDGKHFNKAVNKGKNKCVCDELADALHYASDHLPVVIVLGKDEDNPDPDPPDPNDPIVYITETGSKYHRGTCRCLSKSKIPIRLSEAKAQGYTPCSVCNPPTIKLKNN